MEDAPNTHNPFMEYNVCARLEHSLTDTDPSFDGLQPVTVVADNSGVSISAKGYGDGGSAEGHGSPILLELHQGRLRLLVWADINSDDPTHVIDLDGAQEVRRQ